MKKLNRRVRTTRYLNSVQAYACACGCNSKCQEKCSPGNTQSFAWTNSDYGTLSAGGMSMIGS